MRGSSPFLAVLLLVFTSSMALADSVRLLSDNREAAQAIVNVIQHSKHELGAAYFSVDGGQAPLVFLTMMRDAARRGVHVRLLIDGLVSNIPAPVALHLLECGVEIREYHPVRLSRPDWLNYRLHDKLLIADRQHLIIGSRNLQDQHFGLECVNYIDRDAYIRGDAATCAASYFDQMWDSHDVRPLEVSTRPDVHILDKHDRHDPFCLANQPPDEISLLLDCLVLAAVDHQWIELNSAHEHPEDEHVNVQFVGDPSRRRVSDKIFRLIESAKSTLLIETPYPAFSRSMLAAIAGARARGVEVTLVTNSLASSDKTVAYAAYMNDRAQLLRHGVKLWEFRGPDHIHAKCIVVDGCAAFIGSHNFDARSEYKDSNVAVIVSNPAVAAAVSESIHEHISASSPIDPTGRPYNEAVRHPDAEAKQLLKLRLFRPVVPLIRRSL